MVIEKHCVLICNTPPSMHQSIGSLNTSFTGKNYKELIKLMTEVNVNTANIGTNNLIG